MPENRIRRILDRLREIAAGEFEGSLPTSGNADDLDALAEGINMLAEEVSFARSELEARFSRAHQQLVMAQRRAKLGTWDWNTGSKTGMWGEYMYELFDRDPAAGAPGFDEFIELIHPEDRQRMLDAQTSAIEGELSGPFELRTNLDHISFRVLSCVIDAAERQPDGSLTLRGSNLDVTAHREVSAQLRDANAQMRQLLDSAPYTVLSVQPDLSISYVNQVPPGWPKRLTGTALVGLIHSDSRAELLACIQSLFKEGSPFSTQLRDAEGTWLEVRAAPLRTQGEVTAALVFLVDISLQREAEEARRRLDERMQHAQKLESLGVLAGGIAHDFNNLLAGIMGNAELAQDDLPPDSPATEQLESIFVASLRAADLCRQMLAYAGKGRFVLEPIDVAALVLEMGKLLEVSKSKTVDLQFDFESNLTKFEGDVSQIRQVVMNLITNASDAIESSGVVRVAAGTLDCDADYLAGSYLDDSLRPGRFVWLEVTDDGRGMDGETKRRMFEPFFTAKGLGRGLGLAAVLGIVRAHHGAIRVYSEPGTGTSIRCLFPALEGIEVPRAAVPPPRSVKPKVGRILVVDDEKVVRDMAKKMLERAGYTVVISADGEEGVAEFQRPGAEFDLVLLDVIMPRMNGNTAFGLMRQFNPNAKIVFMSGYNEHAARDHVVTDDAFGFVQKPFVRSHLLKVIETALEAT